MRSQALATVQNLYAAFAKGDVASVLGCLSADIAWTEAAGFPYGGTYHGPTAVLDGVFMRLATEWDGFAAAPAEFIDGGETVVALGTYSGRYRATGKSFEARFAHVWKVRDGQAYSFEQYTDTMKVNVALQA
jgi:ketosteroid isomerase-like protein